LDCKKQNSSGVKEWDAASEELQMKELRAASQTSDGGYLLAGFSKSGIGGDKTIACKGITDYWIVKIKFHRFERMGCGSRRKW
jgi:hypothetical protein